MACSEASVKADDGCSSKTSYGVVATDQSDSNCT